MDAKLAAENGRPDEAFEAYQDALGAGVKDYILYCNLGNALSRKDRHDEAVASFEKAIALSPADPRAYYGLGCALAEMDRHDIAIDAYIKAIDRKEDFAEAHCNLGLALSTLGRHREGLRSLRRRRGHSGGGATMDSSIPTHRIASELATWSGVPRSRTAESPRPARRWRSCATWRDVGPHVRRNVVPPPARPAGPAQAVAQLRHL